ncbi:hypothetical protein [Sulfurovum sp.]|uniref:hypothetical protein n=1 Tax=Sulfurovum sp. TaxID=1969726 RepID=UPI0026000769|nr:hypothetical protein [Sulfurovum sp.]
MKEFIKVYKKNQNDIKEFIATTLKNHGNISSMAGTNYRELFGRFPSLELVYVTDSDLVQAEPNIFKNRQEVSAKGRNRTYLLNRLTPYDDEIMASEPYISAATGHTCITVMKKEGEKNLFMDFRLSVLLGRLGLVELNPQFNSFTKLFYKMTGFSLMAFAFFAIFYALFGYVKGIFIDGNFSLDELFKPIVALTLGLAIFDLAKTMLEREVFFKNYAKEGEDAAILTKFSIAIIIALSIEALMVVFKIALHDYSQMLYAFYLIAGISLIIVSLGIYSFLSKKSHMK